MLSSAVTDEDVCERARQALLKTGYLRLRQIEIHTTTGNTDG
jgi:hypothetical protein